MKKTIIILLFAVFVFAGCKKAPISNSPAVDDNSTKNPTVATSEDEDVTPEDAPTKPKNKICDWIDKSDVIIKLDLPEKYAHYNDETIFPSYETGFIFKSSYGDIANMKRLAQKGCDYRVGFSKSDFTNINANPNYPLIISANIGSDTDFVYENEPIKITIKDGLPEQGNEFTIKVTGEVPSFNHYDAVFK